MKIGKISSVVFKKWKRYTLVVVGLFTISFCPPIQLYVSACSAKAIGFAYLISASASLIPYKTVNGAYGSVAQGVQRTHDGAMVNIEGKASGAQLKVFNSPYLYRLLGHIKQESIDQWPCRKKDA